MRCCRLISMHSPGASAAGYMYCTVLPHPRAPSGGAQVVGLLSSVGLAG